MHHSGNAAAGATLAITSSATGASRPSPSTSSGHVRIPLLAIGSYDATVSANGFTSIADSVKVSLGASSTYTFTLSSSSSMENDQSLLEKSFASPLKEAREHFEKEYLTIQLKKNHGNISKTADFIGMERSALHRKLKSLGIKGIN